MPHPNPFSPLNPNSSGLLMPDPKPRAHHPSLITERIVSALKSMNCPKDIEPHQIQGLDTDCIFPIVQVSFVLRKYLVLLI